MNRRTYELLGRWIAEKQKITVEFTGTQQPQADVKNNRIILPYDIKDVNVFSALSWLIHEASHLKHTSELPLDLTKGPKEHAILNAIEDIRIDLKNFNLLPNIRDFYQRMINEHVYPKEKEFKKEDLLTRVLVNIILSHEGFKPFNDIEAEVARNKHKIDTTVNTAVFAVGQKDWTTVKKCIADIMKKLNVKEQKQSQGGGNGQQGNGKESESTGGSGKVDSTGSQDKNTQNSSKDKSQSEQENEQENESGSNSANSPNVEKYLHPSSMWGKGHMDGGSSTAIGPAAFKDQTKEGFKELLNVKDKRVVHDGSKLDTDNLTDFFTGEVENLFKDDDIIKHRKSKIMFLLDASGSMDSPLLDGKERREVLIKCVKALTDILDEVKEIEGLNINYEVNAFTEYFCKLDQNNWISEYQKCNGGTNVINAFRDTQKAILADQETDGKKLIVVVTDGDVSPKEIDEVKKEILRHNEDVRCMFIGIGANLMGGYAKEIIGDNNILMEEMSDTIIMDTISQML